MIDILILATSGIMMSRHAVPFLFSNVGTSIWRTLHMLGSYWGMILMSFHAGIHGSVFIGMVRRAAKVQRPSTPRTAVLRLIAVSLAVYGVYALIHHQITDYLFLRNQFVFFDFGVPLYRYIADYSAIILLFAFAGYYVAKALGSLNKSRRILNDGTKTGRNVEKR